MLTNVHIIIEGTAFLCSVLYLLLDACSFSKKYIFAKGSAKPASPTFYCCKGAHLRHLFFFFFFSQARRDLANGKQKAVT